MINDGYLYDMIVSIRIKIYRILEKWNIKGEDKNEVYKNERNMKIFFKN